MFSKTDKEMFDLHCTLLRAEPGQQEKCVLDYPLDTPLRLPDWPDGISLMRESIGAGERLVINTGSGPNPNIPISFSLYGWEPVK